MNDIITYPLPGIRTIPMEEYLADPCPEPSLSSGICKTLLYATPAQAKEQHPRLNPCYVDEPDSKFDIGSAAHSVILEGIDLVTIVDADDWRTKAAKEARDAARKEGRIPLLVKDYANLSDMVFAAHRQLADSQLAILNLQQEGDSELTVIWQEEDIWCRCRPDWLAKAQTPVVHYKTSTQSVNPDNIHRIILSFGYDIADAFYRRGIKAVTGNEPQSFFFVQETQPPYLAITLALSPQWQAMADEKVEAAIGIWRKCMKENEWPGYSPKVYTLDPPSWAIAAWEMKRFGLELDSQEEL